MSDGANTRSFSTHEVARMFGISARTVLKWIYTGELEACKMSARPTMNGAKPKVGWRIKPSAVQAMCDERGDDVPELLTTSQVVNRAMTIMEASDAITIHNRRDLVRLMTYIL